MRAISASTALRAALDCLEAAAAGAVLDLGDSAAFTVGMDAMTTRTSANAMARARVSINAPSAMADSAADFFTDAEGFTG